MRCGGIYIEQTLRWFFVEIEDLSIRSTLRRRWMDDRDAVLEDLAHQAKSFLNLQSGQRKHASKEEGQRTEVVRRSTKRPKGREKQRGSMAVQDNGTPFSPTKYACSTTKSW